VPDSWDMYTHFFPQSSMVLSIIKLCVILEQDGCVIVKVSYIKQLCLFIKFQTYS